MHENPSRDEQFDWKDDPLSFLMSVELIRTLNVKKNITYINMVKGFVLLYLQAFNFIGVIYIFKDKTGTYLRQYLSGIFCQQIGIACLFLNIYYITDMVKFLDIIKLFFLPLNVAGSAVLDDILRQCALTKKLIPLMFLMLISMYATLLPVVGDEEKIEFAVMYIKRYIVVCPYVFLGIYYFSVVSLGYSIARVCSACLYLMMHLTFQFSLLSGYLKQLSNDFAPDIDNELYQAVIERRLKFFVQAHNKIKEISAMFLNLGKWSVLVMAISGSLLYTALIYFILTDVSPPSNFRCIGALLAAGIITLTFARSGQALQDQSSELYTSAYQCDWEHWNNNNRRSLLLIIANSADEVKCSSFGILDLGNEIIVRILKVAYSLLLLFLSVNR